MTKKPRVARALTLGILFHVSSINLRQPPTGAGVAG
jgi:hypothetical protein